MEKADHYKPDATDSQVKGISQNLGKLLRNERRKKNISQCKLSDMADVNNSYYCSIEQGEANPTIFKFLRICESLEIEPAKVMQDLSDLKKKAETQDTLAVRPESRKRKKL